MFLQDLTQAVRRLLREPGFATAAVLTLALGVGANVAVFTVVEAVLLRPLPYPDESRLMVLNHRDTRTGFTKEYIATGDYVDFVHRQRSFDAFGAFGSGEATVYEPNAPYQVSALIATSSALEALQVRPYLGRSLERADGLPDAAPVVLLSYEQWKVRYRGDSAIVGRSIRVNNTDRMVVGVTPPAFRFPPSSATDVVMNLTTPAEVPETRRSGWLRVVGRLAPGQTVAGAQTEISTLAAQFRQSFPRSNQAVDYFAVPLRDSLVGNTRAALMLMLAAVAVVLLIACANVANLLLARSLARKREMAVRVALGAGRRRLVTQLLTESLVLAVTAGVAGLAIAHWGAKGLVALVPAAVDAPGLGDVRLNLPVLGFGLGLVLLTALAFGGISALTIRIEATASALVGAGRTSMSAVARRAMAGLVVAEVAFAVMLLFGAGLILRSFAGLLAVDPGFRVENVLTLGISMPADRYASVEARDGFYRAAFTALRARPEVIDVGAAMVTPLTGNNWTVPLRRADQVLDAGEQPVDVGWQVASGSWFKAMQVPLLRGRLFDETDTPGNPGVVIVSEALEQQFFGEESAVGRSVLLGNQPMEVIGVVGNIRRAALSDGPRVDSYVSYEQNPLPGGTLFLRTAGDPARALGAVREVLRELEPNLAITGESTMAAVAAESVKVTRLVLWLLGVFAATALLLAAVGVYGVMAYVVRQQTREIGTRIALGAATRDILWLVLGQGAWIAALGTGLGLGLGLAVSRSLRAILFGVTGGDPLIIALSALVLVATTMLACYVPARRATRVDPARTLVEE